MRVYVRFAATFLSAMLFAAAAGGADLRDEKDPSRVTAAFQKNAKLRLLNVWATWCVPCAEEMPDIQAIDEAFGAELSVVGVSLDDMIPEAKRDRVNAFLDKQRIAFPNIYYTGIEEALANRLGFSGEIPVTFVYDARGKELWRHQGRLDRKKTIAELRALLRRK